MPFKMTTRNLKKRCIYQKFNYKPTYSQLVSTSYRIVAEAQRATETMGPIWRQWLEGNVNHSRDCGTHMNIRMH